MEDFFGIGGYTREPEGYLSFEHILFVTLIIIAMIAAAVIIGSRYAKPDKTDKQRKKVLIVCAVLLDSLEIFRIVFICIRENNPMQWLIMLPLFLCSLHIIALPAVAFLKGRALEVIYDFIFIFGILSAIMGMYGAGNIYSINPVLSFDTVTSALTHAIPGFCSLYIGISGLMSMKKKNIPLTFLIITFFCALAYIVNVLIDYNYMFLMRGDGTPYDILYNLFDGNKVLYPLSVVVLFYIYIAVFYFVTITVRKALNKRKAAKETQEQKILQKNS